MTVTATPTQLGQKWLRYARVLVGKNGNGDVSPTVGISIESAQPDGSSPGLRIKFEITKTIYHTPNQALITIYNLLQEHEQAIDKEYNDLILIAGYQGQERVVFRGNIRFTHFYGDGLDRYAEINAADGDKDFHNALVNFTLAAGHDDQDTIDNLLTSFQATTKGHIHGKHISRKRIRGRTYSGSARDVLTALARENDGHWSIQDGLLNLVPVDSVLPTEAIVVSSDNGLLGPPEVNDKGITIRTMLEPRIVPGGKLWLQNNEVRQKHLKAALTGQKHKLKGANVPVRLDPDGIYKVFAHKLTGDTRDTEWVSECRCVGLDQPIPSKKGMMPMSSSPDGDVM